MSKRIFLILTFSICALFITAPFVNAQFPTDGVVGYWSFDDGTINGNTVQDVLGKNDGELKGNPKVVKGKVGKALEFDGGNSVHIPGTDSLDFKGATEMSFSVWVNADSDSPVKGVVDGCCGNVVAQRDVDSWAFRFDGRNGGQEMEFITAPSWQGDGGFGAATFPAGKWHHVVGIVNENKKLIYVNGKRNKEGNYNGPMSAVKTQTETTIGHASDGGFIGIIDEVVIYNRAVSENEVKQLYQAEGLPVQPQGKLAIQWGQIKSFF